MTTKLPRKGSKPTPIRRKEMNIIFFIDSSRTRSFSVPLSTVKIASAIAAAVCLWTFASIWIIFSMTSERGDLNLRLSQLLTTIFDYQARYDGVYERAYPTAPGHSTPGAGQSDQSVAKNSLDGQSLAAKALVANDKSSAVTALAAKKVEQAIPGTKPVVAGVEIDEPSFSENGAGLLVDFAIKNLKPDKRATGLVWAIARLRSPQGQDIYVGQPPSIDVDQAGVARHTEQATKFTIRRFKPVSVQFLRPEGFQGAYQDIRISVVDEDGRQQEYKFPVELSTNMAKLTLPKKAPSVDEMNGKGSLEDAPDKETEGLTSEPASVDN